MWLYPIAKATSFPVRGHTSREKTRETGAAGFAEMLEYDAGDDKWGISKNFRNVIVGDELVVYATKTTTSPPLRIGLGTVLEGPYEVETRAMPFVTIKWNVPICRRLASDPLDASWLSARLPATKPTVTRIPAQLWPGLRCRLSHGDGAASARSDIEQVLSMSAMSVASNAVAG